MHHAEHGRMRLGHLAGTLAPLGVAAAGVIVATAGESPHISGGLGSAGILYGHVGTHYSLSSTVRVDKPFVVSNVAASVTPASCDYTVRILPSDWAPGVIQPIPLSQPGTPVVGHRINQEVGYRLAVVVTPHETGRCVLTELRIATRSWGRDHWTSLRTRFVVEVPYAGGRDPRTEIVRKSDLP